MKPPFKVDRPNNIVYIEEGFGGQYRKMFSERGWIVTDNILSADLIQFTGGEDVTPSLYGQPAHKKTYYNINRDRREILLYNIGLKEGIPMAGICRGGQFLNVMNGGAMWQHVGDNHTKEHLARDIISGKKYSVTSTHHQMMIPPNDRNKYIVLLVASLGCKKEKITKNGTTIVVHGSLEDIEAIHFFETRCLAFQPHPEFDFKNSKELRDLYFSYLTNLERI